MGGCVGRQRDRAPHSAESSELSGTVGHNKPLKQRRPKWKSDVRLTEAQLQAKRDEFWDTAPAFEGRKEIWDALKACTVALEVGDHQLAQAILDGANISLPNGTLLECYDELGTRYQLPVYVLSPPINLLKEGMQGGASSSSNEPTVSLDDLSSGGQASGVEVPIRLHLSTGRDCRLTVRTTDNILSIKRQIHKLEGVEPSRQRIFFAGRQLADRLRVEDAKIHKGYTLQVVVSELDQQEAIVPVETRSKKSNKSVIENNEVSCETVQQKYNCDDNNKHTNIDNNILINQKCIFVSGVVEDKSSNTDTNNGMLSDCSVVIESSNSTGVMVSSDNQSLSLMEDGTSYSNSQQTSSTLGTLIS